MAAISGASLNLPAITPPPVAPQLSGGGGVGGPAIKIGTPSSVLTLGPGAAARVSPNLNGSRLATTTPTPGQVIQAAAPTGSSMVANGLWMGPDGKAYSKPPVTQTATLTANVTPTSTATNPAPAVINSNTAASDLATKTSTVSEINQNAADQTAALNSGNTTPVVTPATPAPDPSATDTAISDILTKLDSNLSDIESNENSQESTINQEEVDTQAQFTQAANDAYSKLNSIEAGTYPLSPAESQLLDATKASYASALSAQGFANQGTLGKMSALLAQLGLGGTAEGIGMVQNVISTGALALANISTKMATAVGNLQVKLQQQDFTNIQDAWKDMTTTFNDRLTALGKMQTAVSTAANQSQTQAQNYAKNAVTAIINSGKVDQTTAKNLATEAYQQGTLNAKEYADMTSRIKAMQGTTSERESEAAQMYTQAFTPGSTFTDPNTGAVEPTTDANGYITPAAWRAAIADAPGEGMTAAQFIAAFGSQLYAPGGVVSSAYGLTPAQVKLVTGVLPTS